jgi:YD repeat-containing protein
MKKFFLPVLVFAIATVTSCKKVSMVDSTVDTSASATTLLSLETIGTDSLIYKYDSNNRLAQYTHTATGDDYTLTYDASDRIVMINYQRNKTLVYNAGFVYGGVIAYQYTAYYTNGSISSTQKTILTLNADQRVVKRDYGSNNYDTYTYDAKGNTTTESFFTAGVPTYTATFKFDSAKSPFTNVKGNYYIFLQNSANARFDYKYNANNPTSVCINNLVTGNCSYMLNAAGFPISAMLSSNALSAEVHTYKYVTK